MVDDLDKCAENLAQRGFPVTWDDSIPGRRRFHTADGHGNRVEIVG
ncbi:MAG: VOC family protein [Kribbellaceae bacterium]